jgi:hypothetical protein
MKIVEKYRTQFIVVMKELEGYTRGQTITYERVERITGFKREDSKFWTVLSRCRRALHRNRNIATRCVTGIGVELLTSSEQVVRCGRERMRKSMRQAKRGISEVATADNSQLSEHERRLQGISINGFSQIESYAKESAIVKRALGIDGDE